jgi:O-antigen biosynthesis protein
VTLDLDPVRNQRVATGRGAPAAPTARGSGRSDLRVRTDGVFLDEGGRPFRVRGATYGSFLARSDGEPFPETHVIESDFAAMASAGLNTVRTYSLPPLDLVHIAEDHGLRLLVGLHYADWRSEIVACRAAGRRVVQAGRRAVEEAMDVLGGRSSLLAISVGNEIPGDVVRVHGIHAVEDALSELVEATHLADPEALVTYTSYPTTEYLRVEGTDLVTFNVFLERPDELRSYLRHLMVVAGDRPLLITELGLASEIHGVSAQAGSLDLQLRCVDESGCAGATVFSWTDEWGVGGQPVEGWGFGLTDAGRRPRPALDVVSLWAQRSLRDLRTAWPAVSVVVCAYNEERTIGECLGSLRQCTYPNLEVVVCDDGSTDGTLEIARSFGFRVLDLPHRGLSAARNAGIAAATGEIVAFLDADAWCHAEWPYHLALSMEDPGVVATGGPNLPVAGAPLTERAVALAPGGPTHVLVSDDRAEHVPGCNMAFSRDAVRAVGGFDPVFTSAGDDIDVCWKLLDRGGAIAFAPAAQVRHHRRSSVRAYLRQQRGYGRAERMVSGRHRHRFNRLGQARWAGFIYGGPAAPRFLRPIVYHGLSGGAPFQPQVRQRSEPLFGWAAAMLPLLAPVAALGAVLAFLSPWWLLVPAFAVAAVIAFAIASAGAVRPERGENDPVALRARVGFMSAAQPFVRAWGRMRGRPARPPIDDVAAEAWRGDREAWLASLQRALATERVTVRVPPASARWDLDASIGPFVRCRVTTAVVWHWTPIWRMALRPRPALAVTVIAAAVLWFLAPVAAAVALAAIVVELAIEGSVVRRRVRRALTSTMPGSSTGAAAGEGVDRAEALR